MVLVDPKWLIVKVVAPKRMQCLVGFTDRSHMSCFTPFKVTFGWRKVTYCVCNFMQSMIFWCSIYGDFDVQVGGLTYLPLWANVTNYLDGINYQTTCIPHFLNSIPEKYCTYLKATLFGRIILFSSFLNISTLLYL